MSILWQSPCIQTLFMLCLSQTWKRAVKHELLSRYNILSYVYKKYHNILVEFSVYKNRILEIGFMIAFLLGEKTFFLEWLLKHPLNLCGTLGLLVNKSCADPEKCSSKEQLLNSKGTLVGLHLGVGRVFILFFSRCAVYKIATSHILK